MILSGATFILIQAHPGSLLWLCTGLRDISIKWIHNNMRSPGLLLVYWNKIIILVRKLVPVCPVNAA